MTRLTQPFIFLAAFYSAMANAKDFKIDVSFITSPGQPTRIVLISQYCMSEVPNIIQLKAGKAVIDVETISGIFRKCGWEHSSATFEAQNNKKEKKLVFEFYKPLANFPYIKTLWPSDANCNTSQHCLVCGTL